MRTYMFPGQGSQAKGMGAGLFDEYKEYTQLADSILGYSIKELCVEDPRQELNKTQFTQPALYVVNALSYFKKVERSGKPDFLAGHSLGEFNALLAAECFDFETGLRLVKKRGELMGKVTGGGMAAILNATKEQIEATLAQNGLHNVDLANYNTPSQIVISGLADEIMRAQPLFQVGKLLYYPLNTSGAFHSRFMKAVRDEFAQYLSGFTFAEPKIPVIANVTARP
jgi:malonyl CoA-acyl carrier protein transacylase